MALAAVLLAACGGARDPGARLRATFPDQAARVLEGEGFVATSAGFTPDPGGGAAGRDPARAAQASLVSRHGLHLSLPVEGGLAATLSLPGGFAIQVRERGLAGAGRQVEATVAYQRPGGTSFWTTSRDGYEEWLQVDEAAEGPVAEWEVNGATMRQAGDAVELLDAGGAVRLRVSAPFAVAAGGAHARAWLVARGSRLALYTDARGAALIDPLWSTSGTFVRARANHTATLLSTGKVLVAGGFDGVNRLATAELYDPATGTWAATGSLAVAREAHAAVRLRSGQVLVVGGSSGTTPLASAELYDPATGSWSAAGSLAVARSHHTLTVLQDGRLLVAGGQGAAGVLASSELGDAGGLAWAATAGGLAAGRSDQTATLLPGGKVLVAGGQAGGTALASAELFDPVAGTWSSGGAMATARFAQTATLLTGGKVLVAGGTSGVGALTGAELFDPAALPAAAWSATGALTGARKLHSATLLPSGKVVVAGGSDGTVSLASAEVYDPSLGTWSTWAAPVPAPTARSAHTATLLPRGSVLLAGGLDTAGAALASTEQLDAAAGGFTATGGQITERRQHTTTLLAGGKVLVAAGVSVATSGFLSSAELYDPALGTWAPTGPLALARFNHRAVLLSDGNVLVAGGYDQNSSVLATAELYNPGSGTWTGTGSMGSGRVFFVMTLLPNGQVLAVGGLGPSGAPLATAELYDPATGLWTATAPPAVARAELTATLLASGKVLAVGGYDATGAIMPSAEVFDPVTATWSSTGSMAFARTQHSATLLPSGRVLVVGGYNSSGWPTIAELYDPALGTWATSGAMVDGRRLHVAALLRGGSVLVAGGLGLLPGHTTARTDAEVFDPATGAWSVVGAMASGRMWAGAALLPSGKVLVAGGASSPRPAELFDEGRGAGAGWTPALSGALSAQVPGTALALTGSLFTGVSEGSGGGARSSPGNAPLVQLERSEGEVLAWAPVQAFTATTLTATLPATLEPGWHWLRLIVNGVPGAAGPLLIVPPVLQSVAPPSGPTAGGTAVTLGGSGFVAGSTVRLGGVAATNVVVASANVITATTPAHAAGAVDVVVVSPGGSAATRTTAFTFVPPPAPVSVVPSGGLPAGGTAVTIRGAGFLSGAGVTFGGTGATGVVVASANVITATTPAHAAGLVDVVVSNPDGQAGTLTGGFTYATPPTVSAVSPALDRASGGATLTITGTGFMAGATVAIGGTAASVAAVTATTITVTAPPHAAGTFDVVVTNPTSQSATLAAAFTFVPPPTLSAVAPASGWANATRAVTLSGTAFQPGAAVAFGVTSATNVIVANTSSMTALAPALPAGTVSVTVTNPDGQASTLPAAYTYVPPPAVSSVSPWAGLAGGNTLLTIVGAGFAPGASVTLGGVAATGVNVTGPGTITATSPSHAVGAVDVVVTNLDGQSGTLPGGYTYALAPVVSGVSPASGPTAGGTAVTVTGSGFAGGARLTMAGANAIAVTVVSATTITASAPAGLKGPADVQVTNPTGLAGTLAGGFTYVPPPAVGGISPTFGPATLDTPVTITGADFTAGAALSVGGAAASNVVVTGPGTITAVLPPHAAASAQDVVVSNADGQRATLAGAFTWVAPPLPASVTPASGGTGGGQTITVNGSGFAPGVRLAFGGVAAPTVTYLSASSLDVVTPAHAFGPVAVVATNPDGQVGTLAAGFTYLAPAPSAGSVTPASGPAAGGTAVTVSGTGFLPGAAVSFGGASAANVTVASDTAITATVPAHAAGAVDVVVLNVDGQSAKITGGFTFIPPPAPSRISPSSGLPAGGTDVTIGGADFAPGATVSFCGLAATVKAVSPTSITATTPPHAVGACDVVVTNPDGQAGDFRGGYTYADVAKKDLFAMSCAHAGGPGGWLSLLAVVFLLRLRRRGPRGGALAAGLALALAPAMATAQASPPGAADAPATSVPRKAPATGTRKKSAPPGAAASTPVAPGAEAGGVIRTAPLVLSDADLMKDLPPPGSPRTRKPDKKKERVALLTPKAGMGIEPKLAEAVADSLAAALHRRDVPVVSTRDIEAALGFERQRQLHGCSEDASCMAEIGGALGVDRIISGSLARFGETLVLTVQLLDARRATVARRAEEKMAAGDAEQLLEAADRVAYALFPAGGPPPERAARGSWGFALRCVGSVTALGGATTALVEHRATPDLRLALGPTLTWAGRPGGVVRIAWAPLHFLQRWALLLAVEGQGYSDQALVAAGAASAGLEWTPTRHLSVALEVPVVHLLAAPAGYRTLYVTPGLTAGWRF